MLTRIRTMSCSTKNLHTLTSSITQLSIISYFDFVYLVREDLYGKAFISRLLELRGGYDKTKTRKSYGKFVPTLLMELR